MRSAPRAQAVLAVVLTTVLLAGCGGDDDSSKREAKRLVAAEDSTVEGAQLAIRSYCRRLRLYIAGSGEAPTQAVKERTYRAVDELIALAREKPAARYRNQGELRQVLGDAAENLEGTNCSRELVERLRRGLAGLPPPP